MQKAQMLIISNWDRKEVQIMNYVDPDPEPCDGGQGGGCGECPGQS